jgi:hypothetical protein
LVAVAIAVAHRNVSATALKDRTHAAAHATLVELIAFAVAIAFRQRSAAAFVNRSRAVAHAACVVGAHTVVFVVAHLVAVGI